MHLRAIYGPFKKYRHNGGVIHKNLCNNETNNNYLERKDYLSSKNGWRTDVTLSYWICATFEINNVISGFVTSAFPVCYVFQGLKISVDFLT